jgi:hypothetical protein
MRGEKTDIGWKERKECAECVMRRERDDWGMDVAKWEREKGTGSNTEWRHKGDRMDERDMEQERQNTKKKEWEIERKIKKDVIVFEIVIFILDKTVIRNPKARWANKSLLYRRHVTWSNASASTKPPFLDQPLACNEMWVGLLRQHTRTLFETMVETKHKPR